MVGIHARTGREKIFSQSIAHVLNDETQRKYIQVHVYNMICVIMIYNGIMNVSTQIKKNYQCYTVPNQPTRSNNMQHMAFAALFAMLCFQSQTIITMKKIEN